MHVGPRCAARVNSARGFSAFFAARVDLRRLGRLILVAVLIGTTFAGETLGEVLVLHRHGRAGVHLHLMTLRGIDSIAPFLSGLGRAALPGSSSISPIESVHVYAVVATGSAFLCESDGSGSVSNDGVAPVLLLEAPVVVPVLQAVFSLSRSHSALPSPKAAVAALLRRSHALLV